MNDLILLSPSCKIWNQEVKGLFLSPILYYKIQSVCVSACLPVCFLVRNRLQNHAYYGDEAFAGDSVGLGLGQRINFIFRKLILRYFRGKIAPEEKITVYITSSSSPLLIFVISGD